MGTGSGQRTGLLATLIAIVFVALVAGLPALHVQAAPGDAPTAEPTSVSFDFSYVVRVTPPSGAKKVRVWIPLPSSDPYQTVSQVQVDGPVKVQLRKDGKYGDRYAYCDVDSRVKTGFDVRVAFHVVRYERRLDLTAAADAGGREPLPQNVLPFLQGDGLAAAHDGIARVTLEQTDRVADPLEKARRIYDYVLSDYVMFAAGGQADGADSLFIGMASAASIPARLAIGFSLPEGLKQGTVAGYHNWAEFYVNGHGWIPVDPGQALREPSRRDYFFGGLDAHRVMVSVAPDAAAKAWAQTGGAGFVAYPHVEADGRNSPVQSMDFFFNAPGFPGPAPTIFRHPIYARMFLPAWPNELEASTAGER